MGKRTIEDAEKEMSTHSHAEQNQDKEASLKALIEKGRDKLKELEKKYEQKEKQLEMVEETLKAAMKCPHGELKLAIEDAEKEVEEAKLKRETEERKGIGVVDWQGEREAEGA